jgi:hypothetical protein
MAGVGAANLQELRHAPAVNLSTWPEGVYNGSQLFSGLFLDEGEGGVMPVPPLQRFMAGALNVKALVIGTNAKDGTAQVGPGPAPRGPLPACGEGGAG